MANIYFSGLFSKKKAALIESIIDFSLQLLVPIESRKTVINVEFDRTLIKSFGMTASLVLEKETGNKEFELCIDPSSNLRQMLISVAHETVHIKQFILSDSLRGLDKHNGNYWDDPLEIEAYGRELGLFVRWCAINGHTKKKWAKDLFV